MENSKNKLTQDREKEAYKLLFELNDAFTDKAHIVESLHTMFIGYVQSQELGVDEKVVDAYLHLRYILKEAQELFNDKTQINE